MKILAGIEKSYTGNLAFPKDKTFGYLVQERSFKGTDTVLNESLKAFSELNNWKKSAATLRVSLQTVDKLSMKEFCFLRPYTMRLQLKKY